MNDDMKRVRTRSGATPRHISAGYVVVVGDDDREISRRVPGEIYCELRPGNLSVLFVPDEGDGHVNLVVEEGSTNAGWQLRDTEGEPLYDSRADPLQRWTLHTRSTVTVDFADALNDLLP